MTRNQIGQALNLSPNTVNTDIQKAKSQAELYDLRAKIRSLVMERTSEGLVSGTLNVVQQAIDAGDAKSLELSTRAAVNLDKLTASAAGETQKVEVAGQVNVDVRALLAAAFGRNDGPQRPPA